MFCDYITIVISNLVDFMVAVLLDNQVKQGLGARLVHRVAGQLHHLLVQVRTKSSFTKVAEEETIC